MFTCAAAVIVCLLNICSSEHVTRITIVT